MTNHFKDNDPIDISSPRISISSNGDMLQIDQMAVFDNGIYTCRAVNNFGMTEHQIQVVVSGLEAPQVTTSGKKLSAVIGERAMLQCTGTGKPEPNMYWTKDRSKINPNSGSNLIIDPVGEGDGGDYFCHAVNSAGEDSVRISLVLLSL